MLNDYKAHIKSARAPIRNRLEKLGTIKINAVETTPIVWNGKLIRFEWTRNSQWGSAGGVNRECGCYCFIDMETENTICEFAHDHAFGCCYAENGKMFVHGVRGSGGGNIIDCFVSSDLQNWEESGSLVFSEDIKIYNTSVCKGDDRYVMTVEIGGNNPVVGRGFTIVFAESTDLINWSILDMEEYSYSKDRYTACPCIRYDEGFYYIVYLESAPCHRWISYIVRSRDLKDFELGITNPIMWPSDSDKNIIHPERFTDEEIEYIQNSVNCNNSDFDMCYYNGKTIITYSWGNQYGKEFLALAEYDGSNEEFLRSFFE